MQAGLELSSDYHVHLISKTFINLGKQEKAFQRSVILEQNRKYNKSPFCYNIQHVKNNANKFEIYTFQRFQT